MAAMIGGISNYMKSKRIAFVVVFLVLIGFSARLLYLIDIANQKIELLELNQREKTEMIISKGKEITDKDKQIDLLQNKIEQQTKDIDMLATCLEEYKSALNEIASEYQSVSNMLEVERQNNIPDNYYSESFENYPDTVTGLSNYLNYSFELPTSYTLGVFDCSESSAYLEWCLEKQGFDASICIGETPFDSETRHAWVMVNTSDGYRTAIEATSLTGGLEKVTDALSSLISGRARGIVYYDEDNPVTVKYYYGYDEIFDSIDDAVEGLNIEEWNWWVGAWGLN
jgi:hypothetical protein